MTENKFDLSAPWTVWFRKLEALFAEDPEVDVSLDAEGREVTVRVGNAVKADALAQLLPDEVTFGGVTLDVVVLPANEDATDAQLWRWAFDGNPALADVVEAQLPDGSPVTFALFAPVCAQWFADDLTNPYGIQTRTLEDVARDVLSCGDVIVTSDVDADALVGDGE